MRIKFYTPDAATDTSLCCRVLRYPDRRDWHGLVNAALGMLLFQSNWQVEGTATIDETTQVFKDMWLGMFGECSVIGEVKQSVTLNVPTNWLPMEGQVLSASEYPALAAACPELVGDGDIFIPDMRQKYIAGAAQNPRFENDYTLLQEFGSREVTLNTSEIPPHTHEWSGVLISTTPGPVPFYALGLVEFFPLSLTGGGLPHENRPPTLTIYHWIVVS
jgi:microcystin-dependent protein